jgi:site-specific recombinase XerD
MLTMQQALQKMKADIELRGRSTSTLKTYLNHAEAFLKYCLPQPVEKLTEIDVRKFLEHLIKDKKLAPRTVNVYGAAIRFFFAVTLNRAMNYLQIPRYKVPKQLPDILSKDEVCLLINSCPNIKHQSILLLMYGSGLRVSEAASLKVKDIESSTMRLHVHGGKGKKDRYTILSENALFASRNYWLKFLPKSPDGFLFPGQKNVGHITTSAIAQAINKALIQAGISKKVTPHTLRRGFATHLFEAGYNLFQIKDMLGHASIRSTALYLCSANTTADVVSPADSIAVRFGGPR